MEQMKMLQCMGILVTIIITKAFALTKSQNLAPTFMANMTVVRLNEDVPPGVSVFKLAADDKDGDSLLYGLQGLPASVYFTVNNRSGDVTIKKSIDREAYANNNDHFGIIITVNDGINALVKKTLHVYIEDVNDNAPVFKGLPYQADIPEDENVGTEIFKVFAKDSDKGNNGSVTYIILELIPSDNTGLFEISKNGCVYLQGQLDFSICSIYQVLIMAVDQGVPETKNATASLIINVIDIPNKPPEFLSPFYHVRIPENLPTNTGIITVTAIDGDRGINNPVRYSISGTTAFAVDKITGTINVVSLLDREDIRGARITFNITACEFVRDVEDVFASVTTPVTILILDVNDNKPTFYSEHREVTETYHVTVPEDTASGMTILHIFVQDKDQGNNGTFEVFLKGGNVTAFILNQYIIYNEANLALQVAKSEALDYEKNHILQFQIFAVELETQELFSSIAIVYVEITDRNDNSPVFNQDYFTLEVPENSPSGYNVACITASDADSETFGRITYLLLGSDNALQAFGVDRQFGTFFVKNENFLDREKRQHFFVTLQARDGGGLSTNVQIEVSISDRNDEVPVFQRNGYTEFIKENIIKDIVQVQALDRDQEDTPNSKITYTIIGGDPFGYFMINNSTGVISVVKPLDREAMDAYLNGIINLMVQAKDNGHPALSSTAQVTIIVEDMNDNEPIFNQSSFCIAVPEDQQADQCIISVLATDSDATEPNHLVTYRIEEGTRGQFILRTEKGSKNQTAACVCLNPDSRLDHDGGPRNYKMIIAASDLGFDPNTGYTVIEVEILDVNDEPPVLVASSLSDVLASENGRINTTVMTIQALDVDKDAELHFFVRGAECLDEAEVRLTSSICEGWFQVMERSGSLYYSGSVDHEEVQIVQLRVQAVDYNTVLGSSMSEEGFIKIIIVDQNDNKPIFLRTANKSVVVSEFITDGIEVTMFQATDSDTGENSVIKFCIVEVIFYTTNTLAINKTAKAPFYIQTSLNSKLIWEGSLRIRNHVDLTLMGSWKVKVAAVDGGIPRNSIHHLIDVFIVSGSSKFQLVFDRPPGSVLLNQKQIVSILEATVPGTNVIVSKMSPDTNNINLERTFVDVYFIFGNGTAVDQDTVRGFLKQPVSLHFTTGTFVRHHGYTGNLLRMPKLIEQNVSALSSLIDLGLTAVGSLSSHLQADSKSLLQGIILALAVVNLISITLAVVILICIRKRYQCKLKAASAMSDTTQTSQKNNHLIFDVPGTNLHAFEGSNPVWNKNILSAAICCANDEVYLDQKSLNSLDENAIAEEKDYFNFQNPGSCNYQEMLFLKDKQNEKSNNSQETKSQDFLTVALASHEQSKYTEKSGKMVYALSNAGLESTDL